MAVKKPAFEFKRKIVKEKEVKRMEPFSQIPELKRRLAGMSAEQIRNLIKTKPEVRALLSQLLDARRLKARNITATELKSAGYGAADLIKAGFSQAEVNKAFSNMKNKK